MGIDNNVSVVGNITRDPELRFTQGAMAVANFGIAWNKRKKDGEDEVSFFNVTAFGSLAENAAESLVKGTRVVITGTLQQRSWEDKEGNNRSTVEIVADDVAPSLRWASAEITKNDFKGEGGGGGNKPAQNQPPAYDMDEEPF